MTLKKYMTGIIVSTLFCWVAWGSIVAIIDPQQAGAAGLAAFYLTLSCALIGTLTVVGFYGRIIFSSDDNLFGHMGTSFRQACMGALYVVASLILQSIGVLSIWLSIIFLIFIFLLEIVFLARTKVKVGTHG